jgi:RNA polymerase sigma-70 factor (ECF subfamily)
VLPAGFDDFYRKTSGPVLAYARLLAGNMADAEEAAADAYAAAARRWDQFGGYEAPEALVRLIVRQRLAKTRRRSWRRAAADQHGPVPAPFADPELSVQASVVLACFALLPAKQRQVMALCCQEYTSEEIARELGMKPSTVRTHLERARRRLRDALGMGPGTAEDRAADFVSAASVRQAAGGGPGIADMPRPDRLADLLLRTETALREAITADTERMERLRARIAARARDGR